MSEEEVINRLSNLGYKYELDNDDCDAVRKIQDMYKAEKEKYKELEQDYIVIDKECRNEKEKNKELENIIYRYVTLCNAIQVTYGEEEYKELQKLVDTTTKDGHIDYISKDKIKEKIKEVEEEMKQDEVDEFGIHSIGWGALDYVVEQLKELLEE